MKKTPMMALKSVKTLPATMLATERLERSSTGPSFCSRFAAAALERPPGWLPSLTTALIAEAARVNAKNRGAVAPARE